VRSRPFPVVIAAPSGAGKTSIARALVQRHDDVVFSISATTRAPRRYERDGVDYFFVDDAGFDRLVADGELVEWAVVHGQRYGTLRRGVSLALERGQTVVLDIDVQGARQIREAFPEAVLVFIVPPSAEELGRRLVFRGSEAAAERRRRLENARRELAAAREFDYIVVNDDFETAVAALESILASERRRTARIEDLGETLERLDRELVDLQRGSG
jgi:guanylate kinase